MVAPKRTLLILALLCASSPPALADCVAPPAPSKVPDGHTASEQEMRAAMQTLNAYNADVTTYLKCLEFEARMNRLNRNDEEQMHNLAFETLQKIAEKFNEQVRTFKAKSG